MQQKKDSTNWAFKVKQGVTSELSRLSAFTKNIWRDTIVEDKVHRSRWFHEAVGWVVLKVKTKTH